MSVSFKYPALAFIFYKRSIRRVLYSTYLFVYNYYLFILYWGVLEIILENNKILKIAWCIFASSSSSSSILLNLIKYDWN